MSEMSALTKVYTEVASRHSHAERQSTNAARALAIRERFGIRAEAYAEVMEIIDAARADTPPALCASCVDQLNNPDGNGPDDSGCTCGQD